MTSPNPRSGVACLLVFSLLTAGCAQQYASPEEAAQHACSALGPKALSGALIGAAGGAAGGAAIGAMAGGGRGAGYGALAGLAAGLLVGAIAGNQMDKADCQQAQFALQQINGAAVGQTFLWTNNESGSHGSYTAVGDEYQQDGHICRAIRADYYIKNHSPVTNDPGVVCRNSDGTWARVGNPT